jgi:hypothetical protein
MAVEAGWIYELVASPLVQGGLRINSDDLMVADEMTFSNSQAVLVDGVPAGYIDVASQLAFLGEGDRFNVQFLGSVGGFDYAEFIIGGSPEITPGPDGMTVFAVAFESGVSVGSAGMVSLQYTRQSFAMWPTIADLEQFTKVFADPVQEWALNAAVAYGVEVLGSTTVGGVTTVNPPDASVFAGCLDYAASIYTQRISQADFFTSPEQGSTPQQRYRRLLLASRYVAIA